MKKTILKLSFLSMVLVGVYFLTPSEIEAQSDCIPAGCWKTITQRNGWLAMYCGTCTYIENSMGVGTDTGLCYQCPGIG
ncbi:hypothetical protein [Algoriphagus formosus]|uniref:hypothetical protein n=1 Tax=Algoriphagus formosus TaxID=2007308 RepID=UPI0012FE50A8|nr:hypothetical protein [Algoriphagus formosus]